MAKVIVQREAKPTIIIQIADLAAIAETFKAKPIVIQIVNPEATAETIEVKPIVIQIVNLAVKAFIQDTGKLHLLLLKLFVLYLLIIIIFFGIIDIRLIKSVWRKKHVIY
ncbi:MAG: hypothetical protein DMG62_22735 [Acidobacteria bacterium]|nr:MAG: hypothetical protein DMG62_22735 [Acidobacteriota bacterium]